MIERLSGGEKKRMKIELESNKKSIKCEKSIKSSLMFAKSELKQSRLGPTGMTAFLP
jgi:hypothetical protein